MGPHELAALKREWRDLMLKINKSQAEGRRLDELEKQLKAAGVASVNGCAL